ncbi:hypothetical protein SSX86_001797 [Deinandra increscens subsp. villosa]|uniref:Protein FAR1-RELATED SEQUENCE n=1 Tax=Deinandra increscens subsp. villosa TaxID=3103831 RepID=A0AAP0DW28_9ASTR
MGGGDHPPDIGDMQIIPSNLVVQEEDYHADVDETMDLLMINHPLNYVGMDKQGEDIEKHASQIYTLSMFAEVQKEIIRGKNQCYIMNLDVVDGHTVYDVSHMNHLFVYIKTFKVRLNNIEDSYECPFLGFTRNSYLCRHIFLVFRVNAVKEIPGRYIKNRWRRHILPPRLYDIPSRLSVENNDLAIMRSEVMECVSVCIDRLSDNLEGLQLFAADINELKNGVVAKYPVKSAANKRAGIMEELIGKVDDVLLGLIPPQGIRNKGCGTNKRLVGPGEKAVEKSKKAPRLCRNCNTWGHHDSRNCKKQGNGEASTSKYRILALKIP